jgi:hypothetical protein
MMIRRRRRTLGVLGVAVVAPACVASPADEADAARPADAARQADAVRPADAARPVDAGGHGGAQPAHDSGSIGGTQPVPDAGPIGDARPAPDAGPPCAPAALGYACFTAQGEPLPYEFDAPLEGEITAVGTPEADHCDLTVWGQGSGEFVTFQVTEASGRILDVKIDAGGLDAYLDAHPLVVGEPVHIDAVRVGYDIQGEATGFRWLRDGRLAAAVREPRARHGPDRLAAGRGRRADHRRLLRDPPVRRAHRRRGHGRRSRRRPGLRGRGRGPDDLELVV